MSHTKALGQPVQVVTAGLAAAQWWAEALGASAFDIGGGPAQDMLIGDWARREDPEPTALDRFVAILATEIDDRLTPTPKWWWGKHRRRWAERIRNDPEMSLTLGVDYGPDMMLGEAAKKAGLTTGMWPIKTSMTVRRTSVTASPGYQRSSVVIWRAEPT